MAFGIRCNFNRIQSYKDAAKTWRKAVIFPKDPEGPRGLVDKRKKHLAIEKTATEDFILRLYDHPVVTWHKDGSLTINLYPTRSTGAFANRCTPAGMYVSCGKHTALAVLTDKLWYKAEKPLTFRQRDGKWKIADKNQIQPWSVRTVNRQRAKQALKEVGYDEFRLWLETYVQMAERPDSQSEFANNAKLVDMLRNRKWRELVTNCFPGAWRNPDGVLSGIRQAIYRECDCIDKKSVPFLDWSNRR